MRPRVLVYAACLLAGLLCIVTPASAADNIVIIFDASNSMNKAFDGGGSRFEAAVQAMDELLGTVPGDVNAGLVMYGWRVHHDNEIESCEDMELVFEVQAFSDGLRTDMRQMLGSVTPQGMTPLADALIRAGEALTGLEGGNAVILLSDGEGNCGGDFEAAAQFLADLDPPVVLHVIGLDLDLEARDLLMGLASLTGGTYQGAGSVDVLVASLYAAFGQAAPPPPALDIPEEYADWGITNVIHGTDGDDVITGTPGNDLIYGYEGNDFLIGLAGNDVILGGPGNDLIQGMDGNDLLLGGDGNDTILGGDGDDTISGGEGRDSLEGEAGNDCLDGGLGDDCVLGGSGANRLVWSPGADTLLEGQIVQSPCPGCPGTVACPAPPPPPPPACPVATTPPPVPMPAPKPMPEPVCDGCENPRLAKTMDEGAWLQLHGSVTDEDCNIAMIEWSVSAGSLDDPYCLDPVFTAPWVDDCDGADVLVRLVAQDTCGATAEDCFLIHINNVNQPPFADAGPDVVVDEGQMIKLTCTGTDPDGDAVTYWWTIESGGGSFLDPTVLHPTYCAPMTSACAGEDVIVCLTVTDACGASTSDRMRIHINNVNHPPTADAGPNVSVDEGQMIMLMGMGTDPDGDPVTYRWTIESGGGSFLDPSALRPTYCAPEISECDGVDVMVCLTVTDACGASTSDRMWIHINNVNRPPTVVADP